MYPVNVEMLSPSIDTFLPSSTDFFATTGFPAATAVVDAAVLPGAATTFRLPALAQSFCETILISLLMQASSFPLSAVKLTPPDVSRPLLTLPQPDDISTVQHKIPTIKP